MEIVFGPFNYSYDHEEKENGEEKQVLGKRKNKQSRNRVGRREKRTVGCSNYGKDGEC